MFRPPFELINEIGKYEQHHRLSMADEKSEEFRRFILENREIIEAILNEDEKEKKKASKKEKLDDKKPRPKRRNPMRRLSRSSVTTMFSSILSPGAWNSSISSKRSSMPSPCPPKPGKL